MEPRENRGISGQSVRGWVLVIGVLAILAAGVFLIVQTFQRTTEKALQPITAGGQSLQTQVAHLLEPTPTVIPDPIAILQAVKNLARLETIQYTIEKVITAESAQGPFAFLFGDKLILVAHGSVIAGVDLSRIKPGDITLSSGVVTVRLPPPEIFVASLDNQKSYIYNRTTGVLTHGDVNLETTARQAAEQQIRQAALEDGILAQAQINAESFLTHLITSLGYRDVEFIEAIPLPTLMPTPID